MCRNIKVLYNFEPPATPEEIGASARQYVRKISGFAAPSTANRDAFEQAVAQVAEATQSLLDALVTAAPKRSREAEEAKAHERAVKRFGQM
jgi:hypothetical protein